MYCEKCGTEIIEGEVCPKCSISDQSNPQQEQNTQQPVQINKQKNEIFAWIMATIPITGVIIGNMIGFGWACLVLNIIVGYLDEKSLKEQGVDTSEFGSLAFLVPYYLFKRAKALGDSLAYVIVWIVLFAITFI